MGWQDQGRQQHGWFGSGTGPGTSADPSDVPDIFGPDGLGQRAQAVALGALAALPAAMRARMEARLQDGDLERLTDTLAAWARGAKLGAAAFADQFLGRDVNDPVAQSLQGAARGTADATSHTDLRQAAEKLAEAIQKIGLDAWHRFLGEVAGRAGGLDLTSPGATDPVPVVDEKGQPVLCPEHSPFHGQPMQRPRGMPPQFFVAQGLNNRRAGRAVNAKALLGNAISALPRQGVTLSRFRRGETWDAQRVGGINHPEFVDYATVAIGLYAAASQIPRSEILEVQNLYASGSQFSNHPTMDQTFPNLPLRNIENTDLGYDLFRSSRILKQIP